MNEWSEDETVTVWLYVVAWNMKVSRREKIDEHKYWTKNVLYSTGNTLLLEHDWQKLLYGKIVIELGVFEGLNDSLDWNS